MARLHLGLLSLPFLLVLAVPARAQLSPGPLSEAHAHLEGMRHCRQCHLDRDQELRAGCLACHEVLADRIAAGRGLHARPDHEDCARCHHEHHGRDFALIHWDGGGPEAFDHGSTGFVLEGAHAALDCRRCHRASLVADPDRLREAGKDLDRTYLGLPTDCASCHRDPHRGELGDRCIRCHDTGAWRPADGFDHAATSFPLEGRHAAVACAACHRPAAVAPADTGLAGWRFRGIAHAACADCHRDPHDGRLGGDCARCHDTGGWRGAAPADFDHARTGFPLVGKHAGVACVACHGQRSLAEPLPHGRCADCHRDAHAVAGSGPPRACEECHDVAGFLPARFTLDRHAATDFPLRGAHAAVPCLDCHERLDTRAGTVIPLAPAHAACTDCHRDPHGPSLPDRLAGEGCRNCHREDSWTFVVYDHRAWPLRGRHAELACRACHAPTGGDATGEVAVPLGGVERACAGCHEDPHRGQFRDASCDRCHDPAAWRPVRLDHDRDTAFPLTGAHARTACAGCHPRESDAAGEFTRFRPLGRDCVDCHGRTAPALERKDQR